MEQQQTETELQCRLCANKNEKVIGIYSEEGKANDLANKMNLYLPIKVSESDELPLQCCWSCASTVLAWHELVIVSVEADKKLRGAEEFVHERAAESEVVFEISQNIGEDSVGTEAEPTAASLTAYNQNTIPKSPSPLNKKIRKPSQTEVILKKTPEDDENNADESSPLDGYMQDFLQEQVEVKFEDVKLEDNKDLTEWIIKNEETFDFETDSEVKEETKKSKKRYTKIDQEKVNAAKVVVDGRVYYSCKICGKSLHSPYTYIWHMRIHTGERPFVCDLCGKQFRVSQGLVRHLKETHEGIKNFECDICGRMFATRRNVVEHRRIHTNERPYICDLCGKSFKQKASLFVHNRSHTDTFPFKCSYCNQGFRTKPPLMIHITRHTGEKPHPCDVCGRCFRVKYELKRHRLIHSDEKPFVCTECGLSFRQKRYLRNHSRINHGIIL